MQESPRSHSEATFHKPKSISIPEDTSVNGDDSTILDMDYERGPSPPLTTDDSMKIIMKKLAAQEVQNGRSFKIMLGASSIFSMILVGMLSWVVYYNNVQRNILHSNLIDQSNGQAVSTGSSVAIGDLNSEMSASELNAVTAIEALLITSDKKAADISFKPYGWARFECKEDCQAKHVLHLFTPQATLIYHGDESFITDPSESLQRILKDYDIPKFSNFTRRLFPQSGKDTEDLHRRLVAEVPDDMYTADGQKVTHRQLVGMIEAGEEIALFDAHGRKLFLPLWLNYVAKVVWRYVAKRVYKWVLNYAGRWVQQQVTEYVTCAYYNGVEYC